MEPSVIITPDTPEKYRPLAAEIVPPLLALLRERSALEEEIYQRYCTLKEAFLLAGGSKSQAPPDSTALFEEYHQRYLELAAPRCAPGFLKYGATASFARPAKYSYLDTDGEYLLAFTMKSPKKALVETSYPRGSLRFIHRFTLRPGPEGWLIAKIEYHHSNESTWHIDHYL